MATSRSRPSRVARQDPRPRAVYVGTLDRRLDVDGIAALAARAQTCTSCSSVRCRTRSTSRPPRLSNVHVHPSVGRAELIATLRNADLCLVAHRRTPLTEAMSPLKLYEYLAAGMPVLSIDLPPVRDISDRVLLADAVADFVDVIDGAIAGPGGRGDARWRS